MARIKVIIKDKNTLELQENGNKGDLIDLTELGAVDLSNVTDYINAAAKKEIIKNLSDLNKEKMENELLKQENEIKEKYQKQLNDMEVDKHKSDLSLENQNKEIERLKQEKTKEIESEKQSLKLAHKNEIEVRDKEISLLKDMRLKQSTKMLGETLELHCDLSFESIRGILPENIEYGKDTNAREGSLGDRIYREFDENGNETISIMFEMKNEAETTVSKKKNEHFLKELDKDRTQKKCEYAVLVSLLEKENAMYDGVYTVPTSQYKDMFIIRPQNFTQIITWLRNVMKKVSASRNELIAIKQRDIDFTEFENKFANVRDKFGKHYAKAVEKHNSSVDEIDKIIKQLTNMREYLMGSDNQLRLALNDLDGLTVKKLAKNSPSIKNQIKDK